MRNPFNKDNKKQEQTPEFARASDTLKRPLYLKLSTQDQIFFAKRLGMVLRAGLPIMDGLAMLGEQVGTKSSSFIYRSLMADVAKGQTLSGGLEKFSGIFGSFCVNIIRVGETSGTLHENLEHIAEELKKKQTLKRKVIGALIYPAIIILATISITALLTMYLFPKIAPIFLSVKAELPWSTRFLMSVSEFLNQHGGTMLFVLLSLCAGVIFMMRFRKFHLIFDNILLRIPLVGKLSMYYNLSNMCRTLGLLLKSDVRIVTAMDLAIGGLRNEAYKSALEEATRHIIQGHNISSQLRKYPRLFPPMLVQMIVAGEATGNLSSTLLYVSDTYEEEIDELTKNLTTMLEPILMLVMGVIVGFVAISIITPIYNITQNLNPYR